MLMMIVGIGIALAGSSEPQYHVGDEDDWGECGNQDWCDYYNDQSMDDCLTHYLSLESQANYECDWYGWWDGPCGIDFNGCSYLEEEGECLYSCRVVDNNGYMGDAVFQMFDMWNRFFLPPAF